MCSVAVLPPPSAESPALHSQPHAPEGWCRPVSAIENRERDGSTVEHQQELIMHTWHWTYSLWWSWWIVSNFSPSSSPLFFFYFLLPPSHCPLSLSFPSPPTNLHILSLSLPSPISFPPTNLYDQWAESLQKWLRQQGGGALLKAPTQKQQNLCLDGGVLVSQCLNHFILDTTKSRLGRKGRCGRGWLQGCLPNTSKNFVLLNLDINHILKCSTPCTCTGVCSQSSHIIQVYWSSSH